MCACVCVYVYVYISRVILAHHSLFVTVDTPDRIRSRENVINWPCRDIARFIRRNLSVCRFLVVDLLPLSKYSIILVGGDRDRPWIELISPLSNSAAGFRATAFKQLVQQRSKRFHSTAGFAQFHHFPASFRNPGQKLRSQLFLHRDYCYVIINFYSFTRFTFVFTTSTKNRGETSRR